MTDINNSIALDFKPVSTGSTDIIGSLSAFAQLQQAQALAAQARANSGLIGANTQFITGKNAAYQKYQAGLQSADPNAWANSGLAAYPGANETPQSLTTMQTLKGIQNYAANPNDPNSAAAGGPALVNAAIGNQQAQAGVQTTQLANATTQAQLHGQLGTMMAQDPSPQGRAQAAAFAQTIPLAPGETPAMRQQQIQQFTRLPNQQYVLAGQHFMQASMTPEKYYDVSGTAAANKGAAETATSAPVMGPTDYRGAGVMGQNALTNGFTPIVPGAAVPPGNGPVGAPAAAGQPPTPAAAPTPSAARNVPAPPPGSGLTAADMTSSPLYNRVAQYGISPSDVYRNVQLESGGNPNSFNPITKAAGLTNFIPPTWRQYGNGASPFDPVANIDATGRFWADNQAHLTPILGRRPTGAELYLASQQGAAGAAKLILNRNVPAGQLVGAKAIALNGGDPNAPASDFVNMWKSKFDGVGPYAFARGRTAGQLPPQAAGLQAPGTAVSPLEFGAQPVAPAPSIGFGAMTGLRAAQQQQAPTPAAAASPAPVQPAAAAAPRPQAAPAPAPAAAPLPPSGPLNPNAALPGGAGGVPAAASTASTSLFTPRYTPATLAEQSDLGKNLAEQDSAARDAYQQAQVGQMRLQELQQQLSTLPNTSGSLTDALLQPGSGAAERLGLAKLVNTAVTSVGSQPIFDPNKISAAEASQKITGQLGFATANVLGQREAAQIVDQAIAQNPSIVNTPQGGKFVAATINAALQRQKDYYEFLTNWRQRNGSAQGADIAFDKVDPPGKYVQEAGALSRIPQAAISLMQQNAGNPLAAQKFDQVYGPGMSRYYGGVAQ